MTRLVQRFIVLAVAFCGGCAVQPPAPPHVAGQSVGRTIFVPGVYGDGAAYNGLRRAIAAGGSAVSTFEWGMPKLLFTMNFSDAGVHEQAETELAERIDAISDETATGESAGPVNLVGHSAGCGVILGALSKTNRPVGRVVLIAPSVSPGYDLRPALAHVTHLDAFYSDRDTIFLKWRCGTFGGYDRVKTPAAGYASFTTTDPKLTQHAYDPVWEPLGNDGGHGGGTAEQFVAAVVVPLLNGDR